MLETVKILAALLGGGLAGAFITEWFRRRREKVQRIQLIERANRPVNPLEGFILARVSGGANRALEEVKDLREYQLTMRNSTSTHLQNAEIQFEFPAEDVQAIVSPPTLSRTPLVLKDTKLEKGAKVFRWIIPHFPTGDSVEFTFRAVAPSSDKYEVALYYVGIIFEKIVGEPPPAVKKSSFAKIIIPASMISALALFLYAALTGRIQSTSGENLTTVKLAGCELRIVSAFEGYDKSFNNSPWHIRHRIFNVGNRDCIIQSQTLKLENPTVIRPGDTLDREQVSEHAPKLTGVAISMGTAGAARETTSISIYVAD
jgi:hypothetical protein